MAYLDTCLKGFPSCSYILEICEISRVEIKVLMFFKKCRADLSVFDIV